MPTRLFVSALLAAMVLWLPPASLLSTAEAKTAVIHLKERTQPITGELISETSEAVVISIAGIETTIDRARIHRVEIELSPVEQFEKDRAALDTDAHSKRYMLAREAYDRTDLSREQRLALDEAIAGELADLIEDAPDMKQANLLRELTRERIERTREAIRTEREGGSENGSGARDRDRNRDPRDTANADRDRDELPLLEEGARNLLKVYEVVLGDEPNIVVPNATIDTLLEKYRDAQVLEPFVQQNGAARLKRLPGHRQLALMFEARARDLYDEVIVRDEPAVLRTWRTRINPRMVVGYFARHFNEEHIPGFRIHTRRANREAEAYTNYLILRNLKVDGRDLINQNRPEESILVQWSLPRDSARFPAPEVQGWRPYFRGTDDPQLEQFVQWVETIYGREYPIEFEMPKPASEQAEDEAETESSEAEEEGEDGSARQ